MTPPNRRKSKNHSPTRSTKGQPLIQPPQKRKSTPPVPNRPTYVAAIVEQTDNQFLIVRTTADRDAVGGWDFPRGQVEPNESPEQAIRRIALDQLGMTVEIVSGQPPLLTMIDDREVEMRYFFLSIVDESNLASFYPETRWVAKAQLREYNFDSVSQSVADWLVEE